LMSRGGQHSNRTLWHRDACLPYNCATGADQFGNESAEWRSIVHFTPPLR
jgi:hypothetical protein